MTAERWLAVCRAMRDGVAAAVRGRAARAARRRARAAAPAATRPWRSTRRPRTQRSRMLDGVAGDGVGFTVVSEEAGERMYGSGGPWRVVIDPIDGSLNAKRGLPLYALSVAVADGPTMDDVVLGYVYDLGNGEEWIGRRGGGATRRRRRRSAPRARWRACSSSRSRPRAPSISRPPPPPCPARSSASACSDRSRSRSAISPTAGSTRSRACVRAARARSTSPRPSCIVREAGAAVALPDADGPFGGGAARPRRTLARRRRARRPVCVARVAGLLGIGPAAGSPPDRG